jgi:hypothetical protein
VQEALLWLSPRLAVRSAGQAASAQGGQKVLWARPSAAAHAFALVKMNDTPPADTHQPELFAANQRKQPRVAPLLGETRVVKVRLQRRAEGISMFWLFFFSFALLSVAVTDAFAPGFTFLWGKRFQCETTAYTLFGSLR